MKLDYRRAVGRCGVALMLLFVQCGGMNQDQAQARIQRVSTDTVTTVLPGVDATGTTVKHLCPPPDESKVYYEHTIDLPTTSVTSNQGTAERLRSYWTRQGYRILGVDLTSDLPTVIAVTKDGTRLSYESNPQGEARIKADSPCI